MHVSASYFNIYFDFFSLIESFDGQNRVSILTKDKKQINYVM